jgi:hypothetical protein
MIKLQFKFGSLSSDERAVAERICAHVNDELRALLPALPDPVHASIAADHRVIPEMGYGATAMTPNSVSFRIDPDYAGGVARLLQKGLRPALFHECHHLVRGWVVQGGNPRRCFIEGVVCEGLASAFERDAAGSTPPWCSYPDDVRDWVDELLRLPVSAPYAQWMFMHPDGRRWVGYRAGVFIADRAIAASGRTAADLAETGYAEILKLADLPLPTNRP